MMMDTILKEDCLVGMKNIPDESIDMILCDLPYGTTQNKWDTVIPLDPLWTQYKRVIKKNGAIVLTASQPFTSMLVMSNMPWFRYALVWDKKNTTGFLNANRMPLRRHEDILVFYKNLPTYVPQKETRGPVRKKGGENRTNRGCYGSYGNTDTKNNSYYPTSILEISNADKKNIVHPTQKPVELFTYLINTYSLPGDTILDSCMGSGTTAVAAVMTGRHYIGFENEDAYHAAAVDRVAKLRAEIANVPSIQDSDVDERKTCSL